MKVGGRRCQHPHYQRDVNRLIRTRMLAEHSAGAKIVTSSGGRRHLVVVTKDGAIYTWGNIRMQTGPPAPSRVTVTLQLLPAATVTTMDPAKNF